MGTQRVVAPGESFVYSVSFWLLWLGCNMLAVTRSAMELV